MSRLIYVLMTIMLLSVAISGSADAQLEIGNNQDCPDYCDEITSILYMKGSWNPKLRTCEYAYQEECKYGCSLPDSKLSEERDKPSCALFPNELPNNETEARDVIFDIVKEIYQRDVKDASVNIFGTEYQPGDNGTIFIQLLDADKQAINDGLCYVDIYNPDKSVYIDDGFMMHLNNSDGLYYYDLIVPDDEGVFMLSAKCSFYNNITYYNIIQDAYVYANNPTSNFGSNPYIAIGNFSTYASYIQLSDIPIDNLESATLYLYAFYSAGNIGTIYRVTESWNESTVTWNTQPSHDPYVWVNITANTIGWHGYNITELIKNWANGTYTNYGMLLNCSAYSTNITAYYSKEQGGALRPGMIAIYHTTDQLTEIKGSGELHVTRHLIDIKEDVSNLTDITLNKTDEIVDYLVNMNSTLVNIEDKVNQLDLDIQEIRDFQVNELSNNLTEFGLYFDYLNQTTTNNQLYILGLTNLTAEEVWSYYNRTLTDYNQSELINLIFGLNTSIHNLENLTAEQVWTYYNRTLTDIQFNVSIDETAILQAIQNANSSIIQAISDHNQSISDLLYSINTTINDRLDDIEDDVNNLANTTTQNIWEYFNRTLTEFDFTVEINDTEILLAISDLNTTINTRIDGTDSYILGLDNLTAQEVWSFYNRTLTDFSFTVEINNTEILLAIEDSNSSIIDRINLSETNIMNQMDAHNSTIMNKLYGIQGEIAGLENLSAEGVWSYVNRTLTDFQFTVNINETNLLNFLDGMNTSINDNQEIIIADLLNNTDITYDIYSLILNLTLGNVSVQADVDWQEGELVLYNMSSPIQQYANVVSFQSQQSELTVTTQVCKDSSTLEHIVNSTRCFLDQCFESSYSTFQICEFGCKNNMCVPAPWTAILIAMFVALGIVVAIWYLTRDKIDRGRGLL